MAAARLQRAAHGSRDDADRRASGRRIRPSRSVSTATPSSNEIMRSQRLSAGSSQASQRPRRTSQSPLAMASFSVFYEGVLWGAPWVFLVP